MSLANTCKREPSGKQLRFDSQHARTLRAIQIQATGIVTVMHTKGNEIDPGQVPRVETEGITAGGAVQVLHNGQGGFSNQRKSTRAGAAIGRVKIRVKPKYADCRDDETAGGQQRERSQAALAP